MPASIVERFTRAAADVLRAAIVDAGGNEVFLLCTVDAESRVDGVRVLARGNRHAVPALLQTPRPGEVVIHNHPSGRLQPSDADISVASALGNNGVGAYIVDNDVTDVYVIVEPHRPEASAALDSAATTALLDRGGVVARRLPGYEQRPQQLRMLSAVAAAFNHDATLTVEAGTGTGKSLAYLLPALSWSLLNKQRVVVSTGTINLQEQLVRKDLPFLTEQPGLECTTALVKGRGNYLCQRKAAQIEEQPAALIEDEVGQELREILAWSKRTKDGSLSDLAVRPRFEVWEQVVSENDNCLRARCPYYTTCFFYSARRAAAKADIVVVNHHLLMADLALREETGSYVQNAVLPPAQRIIIDEAHHLADVATNYFSARLTFATIERNFGRLRSTRTETKGILPALLRLLRSLREPGQRPAAEGAANWIESRLFGRWFELLTEADQIFNELLFGFEEASGKTIAPGADLKLRVVPGFRQSEYWQRVEAELGRLAAALEGFAGDLNGVVERLDSFPDDGDKQILYLNTELKAVQGRILAFAAGLRGFLKEDETACRWIEGQERGRRGKTIAFCGAPIEVGPLLRKALFEQFPTVIMTSATLAVDRSFDYFHQQVGLDQLAARERVETLRVESPFDFDEQAILAVPSDIPEPTDGRYEAATHEAIREILAATRGGTFVLFTAYGALGRAATVLQPELEAQGLTLLRQGSMNRHHLLERFVRTPRAVLFATDSFWEGVDVRGDALRCVIITRLPFRVPTEPIEQARVEVIEERGGNAFIEHTVPQAVIKLKQGFGRLIRATTDRGAVVLLDSRVVRKPYGRVFLDSLPPARQLIAERTRVYAALRKFYGNAAGQ
ncbi:MAG: DEAD/DEAH box helicase family protein [Deltaproteobacteria bacterium]|nr:DEAD/DEAH box helicase family protein [Deltaproteobacteria bacterium]